MGIPQQAAGHRILTDSEEKSDPDSLGSYMQETSRLVELPEDRVPPSQLCLVPPKIWGDVTVPGELAVTRPTLFQQPKSAR